MSVAIRVENLSKYYRLGSINHGMLYKDIQSWLARKRGKPDPHGQIGADHFADRPEGFWALKDLNFDIQQGDRVGIIGKNGAGKSTLLKILSRITAPTEGIIKIKGRVTSLLEVGTGFHGELTGRENIYLNGAILGMKRREIDRKIDEIIGFSEIEQHIDTPVKRYSSGMYVRLAFAVAAHLDSEILIADEVLAVGDAAFQKKALGKMQDLSNGEGRTILFVSHNIEAVKALCQTGIILNKGSIMQSSDIATVVRTYSGEMRFQRSETLNYVFNNQCDLFGILRMHSFAILEQSNEISTYNLYDTASQDHYLSINGTILNADSKLVIFVTLYDDQGKEIFVSDIFQSGELEPYQLAKGEFCIKMLLPLGILNEGEYAIGISAVVHYRGWIIEPNTNLLYFRVYRVLGEHPVYEKNNFPMTGTHRRPGRLTIALPTTLIRI